MSPSKKIKLTQSLLLLLLAAAASGCLENNSGAKFGVGNGLGTGSLLNASTLVISNVTLTAPTGSGTSYTTTIYFNNTQSQAPISNFCSGSMPCVCNFNWTENNTTSGVTVPIYRTVQTPLLNIQGALVTCNAPPTYSSILNGTAIAISVVPGTGSSSSFTMNPFSFTTSSSSANASFQDTQGNSFQDILRYTCYQQYQRGMSISSQLAAIINPANGMQVNVPLASKFCVQKASSTTSTSGSQACQGQPATVDYTAQSYYSNLYIRDSEQGDINLANTNYHCPQVKETLANNGTVGTQNKVWPLDRTFALALAPTQIFTVGVDAFTKLNDGSPTSVNSSCYPSAGASTTPGSSTTSAGLITSCLGFAAPPNSDGTCPSFRDSKGTLRFTYRLRKYYAIYPPIFDTDGLPLSSQSNDMVYVLDRPVTGPNPLQPYSMAGPKPCPFAYFDHYAVAGGADATNYPETHGVIPGYIATNNATWSGKNVDGIQLPNTDSTNSCSAIVGLPNSTKTAISFGTVNAANPGTLTMSSPISLTNVYIRPVQPWAPHYIEDTSFQACAPTSNTLQDPPLHFARDPITGNVGWCAEVYPTQNPNIAALDPVNGQLAGFGAGVTIAGKVSPFTSHVSKNSASPACVATVPALPTNYPSGGTCGGVSPCAAAHLSTLPVDTGNATQTCDRTVNSLPQDWLKFPLLAPPADTENAIIGDLASYGCTITYDNNGAKTGKSSPSSGCCLAPSVLVTTGTTGPSKAHLEPSLPCLSPNY